MSKKKCKICPGYLPENAYRTQKYCSDKCRAEAVRREWHTRPDHDKILAERKAKRYHNSGEVQQSWRDHNAATEARIAAIVAADEARRKAEMQAALEARARNG